MNKSYFFGDSFTFGDGCVLSEDRNFEYYNKFPNGKIWTTIVSEFLNTKEINLGISGNSNQNIINQIIENLNNFNNGDYIFISNTRPIRIVHPNFKVGKITNLTSDLFLQTDNTPEYKEFLKIFFKNKSDQLDVLNYIYSAMLNNESMWSDFYDNQFTHLNHFLNSLNIKTFNWHHTMWALDMRCEFETINKNTNGEIKDNHWSWNGHRSFSKYITNRIEKKEYLPIPKII